MIEIELKFLLDETSSKALLARLKALKMVAARRVTLRSVYMDTSEDVLKKAGIAPRIRRDGRRWIQTVKTKGKIHGGLSQVGEIENPAPGGRVRLDTIPDPSIREAILRHIGLARAHAVKTRRRGRKRQRTTYPSQSQGLKIRTSAPKIGQIRPFPEASQMEKARKGSGNVDWFEAELADAIDEDYELELSEPALSMERSARSI